MPSPFDAVFAPGGHQASNPFGGLFPPSPPGPSPAPAPMSAAPPAAGVGPPAFGTPPMTSPFIAPRPPMLGGGAPGGGPMATIVPILAAILAGRKDPRVIGTALAGWQEGRERKLAERESAQEHEARTAFEQSETYARASAQSQQQTDAVEHQEWLDSVTPHLRLKGLTPEMFPFNATKAQKNERAALVADLDAMEKRNPDLLQREDFRVVTEDRPEGVPVSTVRAWRGEAIDSTTGQAILSPAKPAMTNLQGLQLMKAEADLQPKPSAATPGSFEDYSTATPERKAQIEKDRKGYLQADDRPRANGNGGPTDYQQFGMSERLASAWTKANGPVKEMDRQLRIMDAGLQRFRTGDTNGGSQAVLVTFQKILDPTSVVRESEYARTTEGQSFLNRIEGYATRIAKGGTTLTDAEMAAMVETGRNMLQGMQAWQAGTRRRIEASATKYGIDPALVFDDAIMGGGAEAVPKEGATKPIDGFPGTEQTYRKGKWIRTK